MTKDLDSIDDQEATTEQVGDALKEWLKAGDQEDAPVAPADGDGATAADAQEPQQEAHQEPQDGPVDPAPQGTGTQPSLPRPLRSRRMPLRRTLRRRTPFNRSTPPWKRRSPSSKPGKPPASKPKRRPTHSPRQALTATTASYSREAPTPGTHRSTC